MTYLFNISLALMAGLMMTRIFSRWRLPDVTAFLITGVVLGPFLLGRFSVGGFGFASADAVNALSIIPTLAMGFIAFSIGNEFRLTQLKKIGKQAFVIGLVQALAATAVVDLALIAVHFIAPRVLSLPSAITLGAIASATAPATTMAVVRQYKAKGEVTELLLPIVALDDAVGLMVFAVSFGVARAMTSGELNLTSMILEPVIEIVSSLVLGYVMGEILTRLEEMFHSNSNRLTMTIAFVFATISISSLKFELGGVRIGFSSLLTCMMLGTVFCNICQLSEDIMGRADRWSTPVLCAFFVLSGASLDLTVFQNPSLLMVGGIYVLTRCVGKFFGSYFSAKAVGCSKNVTNNLGITLFPQEGVALGMCATAQALGADGVVIRNIVLFGVLCYELAAPVLTREALKRSGDIQEKSKELLERRAHALAEAPYKPLAERRKRRHSSSKKKDMPMLTGAESAAKLNFTGAEKPAAPIRTGGKKNRKLCEAKAPV